MRYYHDYQGNYRIEPIAEVRRNSHTLHPNCTHFAQLGAATALCLSMPSEQIQGYMALLPYY